jgi:hypothetical protein
MDALACVDVLDFNNPAAPAADSVDGVHAEPAAANEPRHYDLSHWSLPFSVAKETHMPMRVGCALLLFCITVGSHTDIQ